MNVDDQPYYYPDQQLKAIYELGKAYFDMGYFVPAERIFAGLASLDQGKTPARIGLGLIKLETGLYEESVAYFRDAFALENKYFELQSKLGLGMAFLAIGERSRAHLIFNEIREKKSLELDNEPDLRKLTDCLMKLLQGDDTQKSKQQRN